MMIKRPCCAIIVFIILIAGLIIIPPDTAFAAIHPEDTEANALNQLDIFKGREDGFALGEKPTRVEAAVILLRLIGKEQEALNENLSNNFDDVPDWADAQIGYLFQNGLIKGMTQTHFGNDAIDFDQTMTLILRAMGYSEEEGDFIWNTAAENAVELSVITLRCYEEISATSGFTRRDLAGCIFNALQGPMKSDGPALIKYLLAQNVITENQVISTGISDLMIAGGLKDSNYQHYYLHQEFTLIPYSFTSDAVLKVNLPDTYYNRQKVIKHTFSISPDSYYYDGGSLFAVFKFNKLNTKKKINITTELEICRYDLDSAMKSHFPVELSEEDRIKYTSPSYFIESDDPVFVNAELDMPDSDNELKLIKELMDFTTKHMTTQITYENQTALAAYDQEYGDCFEYSAMFIALCRSHGIPARMVASMINEDTTMGHAIVEVYLDSLGWVPFDPVNIDTMYVTFNRLNNYLIYFSDNVHSEFLDGDDFFKATGCLMDYNYYVNDKG